MHKKIEQNYLDGLTLAIVFLRAKHAAPVQLCSLCNFEHWMSRLMLTYESLNKKPLSLSSRELIIELKLFESAMFGPLWPNLQKMSCGIGRFDQKSHFFI